MSVATNSERNKHQKREIKDFNSKELFNTEQFSTEQDFSEQDFSDFSKVHFSLSEYDAIRLKDRIPAIEVVEFIRFKSENNYSDRIDLTLTPYLRLIIECIGKKGIYWLICIAPTQSGKTTVLQVFVADHMDQKGGYFFYIMPTGRTAVRAFQDKVTDMVEATPRLLEHVLTPYHENMTNFVIRLDNSSVFPVTCGSLAEMSGMTTSGMAIDEIRLMPLDTLDESNVVQQSEDRMTVKLESGGAQGMIVSSPSREEDLLHKQTTREFTTVLHWYTMCPSCRKMQRLNFWINMHKFEPDDIQKENGEPIPQCLCRYCSIPFDDSNNKREMNATGKYGREGLDGIEAEFFPEPELNRHVVFWWNSLNSPFRSFENIYKKYISVRFKPEDLKNFLISWLAEFQKNEISKSNITMLNERVNHNQTHGRVPEWTKIITAGIDTQDTGFYYVVEAHGVLGQSSIIDYGFIESRKNNDSPKVIRKLIRDYFEVKTYHSKEKEWAIGLYAADAGGHRTKEWYEVAFSFAADDDENLEKLKLCLGRGKVDGLKETAKKGVYFVNTGIALDTTEDLYSSSNFSIYSGEHFNFFTQLTNYRKVKEIEKKTFAEKFYWKKNGQFDYRMAHVHSQIALGFRLNRKRIMDCLNDNSWEYNPIAHVKNKISEDSLKKESVYIEGNNDIYSFTDRGIIM